MRKIFTTTLISLFAGLGSPSTHAATLGGTSWNLSGTIVPNARLVGKLSPPAYSRTISTKLPTNPVASSTPAIKAYIQFKTDGTFSYFDIDALAAAAAASPFTSAYSSSTSGSGATATTTYSRKSNVNVTDPNVTAGTSSSKPADVTKWVSTSFSPTTATAATSSWTQSYVVSATAANNTSSTAATNPAWTFNLWTPYTGTWTETGNTVRLTLDERSRTRLYYSFNGNTSNNPAATNYANYAFNQQSYVFNGQLTTKAGKTSLTLNQTTFLNILKAFSSSPNAAPKGQWSFYYRYLKKLKSQ